MKKAFKAFLLLSLGYVLFIVVVLLSIDCPVILVDKVVDSAGVNVSVDNLRPEFKYKLYFVVDKNNISELVVEDGKGRQMYKSESGFNPEQMISFGGVDGVSRVDLVFQEKKIVDDKTAEIIDRYNKEKDRFYMETFDLVRSGDGVGFSNNMKVIVNEGPFEGQNEYLGLGPYKNTILQKVIVRPEKKLGDFIVVNKMVISYYKDYLNRDIGFKVIYLLVIGGVLWGIVKTKKEIRD